MGAGLGLIMHARSPWDLSIIFQFSNTPNYVEGGRNIKPSPRVTHGLKNGMEIEDCDNR